MKKLTVLLSGFIIIFSLLSSCSNSKKHSDENTLLSIGRFEFNSSIDSLLHLFIQKADCHECYYEMYVDKKDVNETLICLRASLKYPEGINSDKELIVDYVKKKRPTVYTVKDNRLIFIYSGIEDLVVPSTLNDKIKLHKDTSSYFEYTWVVRKVGMECHVYEETWVNPFEKNEFMGTIKFEIPDSVPLP